VTGGSVTCLCDLVSKPEDEKNLISASEARFRNKVSAFLAIQIHGSQQRLLASPKTNHFTEICERKLPFSAQFIGY